MRLIVDLNEVEVSFKGHIHRMDHPPARVRVGVVYWIGLDWLEMDREMD